ncbi:MAG: MAPEG family protein [Gammaproteobacteria bacterium]|jgi:hypothetical protein|nr:MAPEG family protein [Gammaproteobacteria bacterium]
MDTPAILGPAAVLVLWSLIVLVWMLAVRAPAFANARDELKRLAVGGRYVDIEQRMPAKVNWVSHNYSHLMEQPTLFYAVVAILALAGDTSTVNLGLAWGYTGLRVVHSLWQGLFNIVRVRALLFLLSTVCLVGLAINAVRLTVI